MLQLKTPLLQSSTFAFTQERKQIAPSFLFNKLKLLALTSTKSLFHSIQQHNIDRF